MMSLIVLVILLPLPSFQLQEYGNIRNDEKYNKSFKFISNATTSDIRNKSYLFQRYSYTSVWQQNNKTKTFSKQDFKAKGQYNRSNTFPLFRETSNQTRNDDIFISVRTTEKFHQSRLQVILNTWYNLAPEKVRLFYNTYFYKTKYPSRALLKFSLPHT